MSGAAARGVATAALALVMAVAPGAVVRAQVSEAQRQEARNAYTQGQGLFQEGKYEEARAVFQGTYDLVPNPIVLLSMAECDVRLGHIEDAVNELERYLAERPDAADRADVEKKIADLKATPTTLIVKSTPAGAAIQLDGKDSGQVTPAEITVEPGEHTVAASLTGHDMASSTLTAKLGSHQEIELTLPALPPPPPPKPVEPPPPPPPPPPPKPVEEPPTTALWVCGIVGGVGIVSGTVLGILALGERSDFNAHPTASAADRGERLALFADVSFGVATMAVVTGAVLLLTSDSESNAEDAAEEDKPSAADAAAAFTVAPVVGRERAGVVARMSF